MTARFSFLVALLLILAMLAGCEAERVSIIAPVVQGSESAARTPSALVLLEQALEASAKSDYPRCASRFAAAAKASQEDEAATCWYRASQCAARAGDYRLSRFHMQTAASAGFANLDRLRSDPLLRPMQSNPRWLLIDDAVSQNQIAHSTVQQESSLCQASSESNLQARFDSI
jgi:hypothetical protein